MFCQHGADGKSAWTGSADCHHLWRISLKAFAMKTAHVALVTALLAGLMTGSAFAQGAAAGQLSTLSGSSVTPGQQPENQQMTPLATLGNLAIGIWTPVAPPYDVTANRSAAANPLP
jgi:hypothetical protein